MHAVTLTLPVAALFRLDLTMWVLRRREKNALDRWDGREYSRIVVLRGAPVRVIVSQNSPTELTVKLHSPGQLSLDQQTAAQAIVHRMLGLAVDVQPFQVLAAKRPELKPLVEQFRGVRPPRFPTIFEALVNAISCQQISLDAGITLLNRLAETYGPGLSDGEDTAHAFPRPEDVLDIPEEDFRKLGFSYQKARATKAAAYAIASGELQPEELEHASNEEALSKLQTIRGIGRWSAEYVLLRGLGRLDIFPGDDIGGQNNIQKLLGLSARPGYEELKTLADAWHPYAGFVYFHLLLGKLHEKGLV